VSKAAEGISGVLHLAAILPPNSEKNKEFTFKVNVDGTNNIVEAIKDSSPDATIVFTSSISTYGDTSAEGDPITIEQSQNAIDVYAESKIAGEKLLKESGANFVILRIASIAVPEFLEPPEPWPFTSEQRVEMIHRDDVADAIKNSVDSKDAIGKIFNIAGGDSWRLRGKNYVEDFFQVMGAPVEMAVYRDSTGWNDWYDTTESQRILSYQNRSYSYYGDQMKEIIRDMMEE
jgi:nucleoside-diphosphate-sugar epimerase